ncbi:MAG: carboxypeptidase regulatory-like domain-containing protein [Candidatus Acidiferrales bacterium]
MTSSGFGKASLHFDPSSGVSRLIRAMALLAVALLLAGRAFAGVTASISGTVKDTTGAAVVGAKVTATNTETSIASTQPTNGQGFYSFQSLPLGHYDIEVQQTGFKAYRQTGLMLDVNAALVVDVTLQVGQVSEKVEVTSNALHVETANTQMGEVIEGSRMTAVPLVTRSYTDLLALQPGVVSQTSGMNGAYAGAFIAATWALPQVSGDLSAGALSVNGQREAANGFILNGITVQETGFSGAGAVPDLDSIAEFRILTNNFDAEYGNYSGGQINVITKSGTKEFHGSVFEFLRNTHLDAANFFESGHRGSYHQNQFGGTFGGPIKKDKLFFFADYQGNRVIQAVPQVISPAPSAALLQGDLTSAIPSLAGTTVNGATWATQLTQQFSSSTGQVVTAGEPYFFAGCTLPTQCVFPNAKLPTSAYSPISTKLLPFIQPANNATQDAFSTSSGKINLHDNKFSGRVDGNSRFGLLSAYYYFDKFDRIDPYWASPRPLYPGFGIASKGWTHNVSLGATKTFGSATVNEFRLGFFRLDTPFNQPLGGTQTKLAQLGFASGANRGPGIFVGTPAVEGIPETDFNNFSIGVPSKPIRVTQNSYQALDNFSKVIGTHTLKFGAQYHYNQLEENLSNAANGLFSFGSAVQGGTSETGSDVVDFLIGAPSGFVQGLAFPSRGRGFYLGLFAQDSWRIKSNLTFNYGLRYDVSSPWHEMHNQIQTIIPGEQSVVFPGSPKGWLFPGDPGVPSSLAPTRWNNFGPRLGLAYSPEAKEGFLRKLLGGPGATSIRVGYGMFFTALEGATNFVEIGDAPFGDFTGQFGQGGPSYAAPFTNRATGTSIQNFFPVQIPPQNFSARNPASGPPYDTVVNFLTAFGTIGSSPAFNNKNRLPYAENYELSVQRQLTSSDLLTLSYVGTQGHRLLLAVSANPGSPALCLQLIAENATPTCGPGGENNVYTLPGGALVGGSRTPLNQGVSPNGVVMLASGPVVAFGNDSYFKTIGNSAYNSAQVNWRHTSGRLQTLLGYTFSKALDLASGFGEQINPVNPKLSRGLSGFDSPHNFVFSYNYSLPFDMLGGPKRLTNGWAISGITRFATGLPITLVETDDQSLLGTAFGGPIPLSGDTPNLVAPVQTLDPRKSGCPGPCLFFNPSSFQGSALGQGGNANRRFFHGPGVNNWDFAILKNTQLNERFTLQFRGELFNIFNHAQFIAPSSIGLSNFNPQSHVSTSGSFGSVTTAAPPRIAQLSLKLNF